jgi:hypothetical protein
LTSLSLSVGATSITGLLEKQQQLNPSSLEEKIEEKKASRCKTGFLFFAHILQHVHDFVRGQIFVIIYYSQASKLFYLIQR